MPQAKPTESLKVVDGQVEIQTARRLDRGQAERLIVLIGRQIARMEAGLAALRTKRDALQALLADLAEPKEGEA
jgi:hypothetical protein